MLGRGVGKRVARYLPDAVTVGEQLPLPSGGLVKRGLRRGDSRALLGEQPFEPLLRGLEVGGELGLLGGVLLGEGLAPLLGFPERGFERREPGPGRRPTTRARRPRVQSR